MIHIIDGKTDELIGFISDNEVLFNTHKQSLENQLEQFDFECLPNFDYADKLTDRNRLIIPSEDDEYIEFIIQNVIKTNDRIEVYTTASYLDLIKAKVIHPTFLESTTATAALSFATNGTEWVPGLVESNALSTIEVASHTNPFTLLKRVANEFNLELRFRTETNGNRVTNRYVDLLDRVGTWDGREVTFGKDLDTIERSEDTSDIYTALLCLGPEDADGNRLEVLVEDEDALQRWGRPDPITGELKHLIGIYEPQSERLDMTLSELEQYGCTELNKRINAVITYSANIVDLEHVPGMENKKIRFGDTIRIKDEKFSPPLYVEARVFEQSRDIFDNSLKEVKLGDFVEFTEEQVLAIWKQLQEQIKEKISQSQLFELTYDKQTIDGKDTQVKTDAEQDATQKAQQAESVAKDHADQVASTAESNAINYTNTVKSQIDAELLNKAGLEYVNGQLALKADSALVNTINNTVADLETTASNLQQAVNDNEVALNAQGGRITTVETDLNTVEGQLSVAITDLSNLEGTVSSQGTQISANTSAISLKANQSELDTVSGNVSDISSELNVLAGQVELKASQSALTNLANDVTQISSDVSSLQVGVNGITADVSSLETTVNGHTTQISSVNSSITQLSNEISQKVSQTEYTADKNGIVSRLDSAESNITQHANQIQQRVTKTEFDNLQIGGRNLYPNTSREWNSRTFGGWQSYFHNIPIGKDENLNVGDQITWSGVINPETQVGGIMAHFELSTGGFTQRMSNFISGGTTGKVSGTTIVPVGATRLRLALRHQSGETPSQVFNYKELKIEKGNKATDWTPAPEDVQSEIDSVYSYAESEITQLAGRINLKADATTVNNINTRLSTAELDINALDGAITSKVEVSTFNTLKGRVDTAESTITQQADEIDLKVNKNGVISSINQTAETVKIQASKINLEGYVTVTDLEVDGNIKFGGQLQGASGSFEGDLTSDFVTIGSSNPSYSGFSRSGLAVKMPERISTGNYTWNGEFVLGLGNGLINFGLEDSGFSPTYSFDGPIMTHQGLVETIVSKGSNSKGRWIKYSSGKMEVWCTPIATSCTNTSGNVYRSDVFDVDFPQNFDDSHPISVAINVTATGRWADIVSIPSSTGCRAHQYSTVNSSSNISAFVYAVGMALVGVG